MNVRQLNSNNYHYVFLLVESGDHITAAGGLSPVVTISKNGGPLFSPNGVVTEIGNGLYCLSANATDRNTLGELIIHATADGADPHDGKILIVAYNPFDVQGLGLSRLDAAISDVVVSSGDPLRAPVPGAYLPGQAGYKLGLIGSNRMPIDPPASTSQLIRVIRGDDYLTADGRALDIALYTTVDLTGATLAFNARLKYNGSVPISIPATVLGSGTLYQSASVEMTSVQTSAFSIGEYSFEIEATLTSGSRVTVASKGIMRVQEDIS